MPRADPMPQTIEAYKKLAQRDLELIEDQRDEIAGLKCKINDLKQRLTKCQRTHINVNAKKKKKLYTK